jgi:probable DNA metabolism protein
MTATEARLASETDLAGFRAESRDLLAQQVHPDSVQWQMGKPALAELYTSPMPAAASRPRSVARAATAIVPASFLRLCESVVLHRDPERFSLLYRLLWRLVHEPGLRNEPTDPDMMRAQHMAHAVRRDIHKMKTYLRFVPLGDGQVAYYEPSHHVLEVVGPWFARRIGDRAWAIFTPERSVRFDGRKVLYGPGLARDRVPAAEDDAPAWQACMDELFRPAAAPAP